ncbi:hypothetical protein [Roseivirga sp. E12]|uniref:hypothetical protein n=1 Tax=Roseivirga sp. E12 TaxID=2819237 RepID=UPI001ABD2CE8|nr:hypothetical protein [Roseivirga sp. E12]MBO3698221.1 hypothetical protein [Roseivirga sp. E12]
MKRKIKVLVAFSLLMVCMSSCVVYSLFPIYTPDTLVYLPELEGTWQSGDDEDDHITFERMTENEAVLHDGEPIRDGQMITVESEYTDSISGNGWSIKSGDSISITRNGVKITDRDAIIAHYDTLIGGGKEKNHVEKSLSPLSEGIKKLNESLKKVETKFQGTAYIVKDESYKMTFVDDDERFVYQAHIVRIGEDYFLDLYPLPEYSSGGFGENLFPVHTFMKMDVTSEKLNLTLFDLEKLSDLFKSNLVRLRHENVDGTILITAQPKEIQKFLERYSDDESVFESVDTYSKISG